ncbi:MAG TPA: response regulator [Candidatus Angelobacter sp.]|nr:response regulator [Candidatus Angelobacter sp.]
MVVEDEALIGLELESLLRDEGATVIGPIGSVRAALASFNGGRALDGALLDINLGEEKVFPVADALAEAHVPFVFLTGHSNEMVPSRHRGRPVIRKPYLPSTLLDALCSAMAQRLPADRFLG